MKPVIRRETPADIGKIHDVTVAAFLAARFSDHTEQFIVAALRDADALTVSLVAEDFGEIVGHIAISPVTISDAAKHWYGLGPVSVLPEAQGKGTGSRLTHAAVTEIKALGANGCVVLGDPEFYCRFGFMPTRELVLPDVPPEYFQALSFSGKLAKGEVTYHEAFLARE